MREGRERKLYRGKRKAKFWVAFDLGSSFFVSFLILVTCFYFVCVFLFVLLLLQVLFNHTHVCMSVYSSYIML